MIKFIFIFLNFLVGRIFNFYIFYMIISSYVNRIYECICGWDLWIFFMLENMMIGNFLLLDCVC